MNDITERRLDIERREREERQALLGDHIAKFSAEKTRLAEDCAAIGHVKGQYWNNGLGWEWFYCCHCRDRIPETVKETAS
jgi:hypothetical protein